MSGTSDDAIDQRTVDHIRLQGRDRSVKSKLWRCGCTRWRSDDGWYLCSYHQGFDEGVDTVLSEVERGKVIAPEVEEFRPDNHPSTWTRLKEQP